MGPQATITCRDCRQAFNVYIPDRDVGGMETNLYQCSHCSSMYYLTVDYVGLRLGVEAGSFPRPEEVPDELE